MSAEPLDEDFAFVARQWVRAREILSACTGMGDFDPMDVQWVAETAITTHRKREGLDSVFRVTPEQTERILAMADTYLKIKATETKPTAE